MQQNFTMNGLQMLLYFPFKDAESRKKLAIASAMGLASFIIPIIPSLFLLGYAGMIMRQIIVDNQEPSMPDWMDWNELLSFGAKLFGVIFIYTTPALIPLLLGYFGIMLPALMDAFTGGQGAIFESNGFPAIFMLGTVGGMALFALSIVLSLLLWIVLPPALGHVVAKNSFAAGFQVRGWWKVLKANIGGFVLSLILGGGLYIVMMMVFQIIYMTLILCCILPFLMAFISAYMTIVISTLFAQAYHEGSQKLEA